MLSVGFCLRVQLTSSTAAWVAEWARCGRQATRWWHGWWPSARRRSYPNCAASIATGWHRPHRLSLPLSFNHLYILQ